MYEKLKYVKNVSKKCNAKLKLEMIPSILKNP